MGSSKKQNIQGEFVGDNKSKFRCQKKLTVPKDETQESSEKQNTNKLKKYKPHKFNIDKLKKNVQM